MKVFDSGKLRIGAVLLCAVMAAGVLSLQTKAEGENKFSDIADFTDISLWDTDDNKKIEGTVLLEKDVNLELRCEYKIEDEKIESIMADTPYYLEVSPHLVLPLSSPLTVKIDDLEPVECGKICSNGTDTWIELKADDEGTGTALAKFLKKNNLTDFQGYFYLQCSRAGDPPAVNEENRYTMEVEGRELFSFGYQERERTKEEAEIEKDGSLSGKTITWTIDYTPWQNPDGTEGIMEDTPFELRDTIDAAAHSYVAGSIKIDGAGVTEYDSEDEVPEAAPSYAVIENSESGTVLNIGGRNLCAGKATEGNPAQPIKITYQTTLNDKLLLPVLGNEEKPKVSNGVKLWAKKGGAFQELEPGGSHEITVEPPEWIEKEGTTTRVDNNGSYTDWTITFNSNDFTFPEGSKLTLHDQLPGSSTLEEGSIMIDGVGAEESDIKMEGGNQFSVLVDKEVTGSVTINYRTTVPEELYENGTNLGENIAWFTFSYQGENYGTSQVKKPVGSGTGSGSGTDLLVKNNGGYQEGSRSIEWTVDINPHRAYLKSGTFTDNLRETVEGSCNISGHEKGLKLVGGVENITVLLNDAPILDSEKELVKLDYAGQMLTVTVGDVGRRKVTLNYTTKVCDPCIFANNTKERQFKNRISTENMVIGESSDQERSASGGSTVDVSATVLTKKAPVYDYGSGVMQWTMEVNEAGLDMKGVVLTDALPAGLAYADGDGTYYSDVNGSFRTEPAISGATLTVSNSGKNLTFNLGNISAKTLVKFQTKVDPMSAGFNSDRDVEIVNTAVMKGTADGVSFEGTSNTVRQNFVNHGLVKSSTTNNQEEWIEYEVLINPFSLTLPQTFSLVDTLDGRLQLDTDTLRLYRATVSGTSGNADQKPNYAKTGAGQPLQIAGYDPETNSFTVKLSLPGASAEVPEPEKSAYLLVYRADIVERRSDSYGNSVRFEGGNVKLGGVKQNSAQVSGGGIVGGGAASRRVNITVSHTDSGTGQALPGVTYTLYQWDTVNNKRGMPVAQGVTDAQGKVTFKVKPGAVYELVQTKGISGYDNVPGWEQLPEGVQQGGKGLLVTAEAAGSKRELKLTNKVSAPGNSDTGGTGDSGNNGSGDHTGNGGGSDQTNDPGTTDQTEDQTDIDQMEDQEDVDQREDAEEESHSDSGGEDENGGAGGSNASGRIVKSPQTGEPVPWCWPMAVCSGILLAVTEIFRCGMKKRNRKRS